jgi:hypothetical protein
VLIALGAVVVAMTGVSSGGPAITLPAPEVFFGGGLEWSAVPIELSLFVLLTRGLGQSALSVISLALVGRAAGKRPGLAIGVYSFLVSLGFMGAFIVLGAAFKSGNDWKVVWSGIGWSLIGFGFVALFIVREPERIIGAGGPEARGNTIEDERSLTIGAALWAPVFWVFALATSYYGLVSSGHALFSESLLAERGFSRDVYLRILGFTPPIALAANLLTGYLTTRIHLGILLSAGMLIFAGTLAAYPYVSALPHVYAYASGMALAGGVITVLFFTVWRQAFGPEHLGKIQAPAQLLTVIASSFGPLVFAAGQRSYGSYAPVMQNLAFVAAVIAVAALIAPLPRKDGAR